MSTNNMVADEVEGADMLCCASCGITTDVNGITLKECTDFDLVRYCSDKCQQVHQPQHEATCQQWATELRDEILFKQPESSHLGDCPICFLPLSLICDENTLCSCCSTRICNGCAYAYTTRQLEERKQEPQCAFCRSPVPKRLEENIKYQLNTKKRAASNDPVAIIQLSKWRYDEGDYEGAFEYIVKAAEVGDVDAYTHLSHLYRTGEGVEKDEKKGLYYLEKAAIAGHHRARYNLAMEDGRNERFDRAVKHFIISANLGDDESIKQLKICYKDGLVSKEDFAAALRAHQAAVDATKSPQREVAAEYFRTESSESK